MFRKLAIYFGVALFSIVLAAPPVTSQNDPRTTQDIPPTTVRTSVVKGSVPCRNARVCPPGWWSPAKNATVYDQKDREYKLTWTRSFIEPPGRDGVPAWFTVVIDFWNYGDESLPFTCRGMSDPALAKEWFQRDGKNIGYVPATETLCSKNPELDFTLEPGEHHQSWATFHNVPWRGDSVSIEWEGVGVEEMHPPPSAYVNPYGSRPSPLTQEGEEVLSGILERAGNAVLGIISRHVKISIPAFGRCLLLGDRMWEDGQCVEILNTLSPFKDTLKEA
ncbi:hypothetical protein ACIRD9_31890 [Streptomyces violaceus]|uniref:hypothetical protein n=1 Tax=Streptomyces violaceus TaxID=1936 RepID=UPI00380159B2